MNRSLTSRIMDLLQRRYLKETLAKIALMLSCIAIFVISYMLVAPVLTQEWDTNCGMEEHAHTESCYTDVLVCGLEEAGEETGSEIAGHEHSDACYEVRYEDVLVCGMEEGAGGHTHSQSCYTGGETTLVCTEPEGGHTHSESCYSGGESVLTCTEPTGGGHTHSDSCYTVETVPRYKTVTEDIVETVTVEDTETVDITDEEGNVIGTETVVTGSHEETRVVGTREVQVEDGTEEIRTLTCGETESQGHEHTGSCYTTEGRVLTCTEPEGGHTHTESCYVTEGQTLTCTEEESPGHVHDESCYERREVKALICAGEAPQGHVHTESCYERRLTCGMEEHTHTDLCYQKPENKGPDYICGFLTEHTHGEDCYFENGELKCNIPEHLHDESCLPPQKLSEAGGSVFPEELPEGYVQAEIIRPDAEMFAMSGEEEAGGTGPDALDALVYFPVGAFDGDVVFVPQLLTEDDGPYMDAAEALDRAGAEYDSMTAMDLSFFSLEDYEPREPDTANGPVYVRLTLPMEVEQPEETALTLWHCAGDGAEEVTASAFRYEDGVLTVEFAADSFSTYTLTVNEAPAEGASPVSWGATLPSAPTEVTDSGTTWDISNVNYRYVDIPVSINVSNLQSGTTVTLPYTLDIGEAGRNGYKPQYKNTGSAGDGWTVTAGEDDVTVTIHNVGSGHKSIDVYYRFDCWQVASGRQFTVNYSYANGGEGHSQTVSGTLTGCVRTGTGGTIIPYLLEWDESLYSFNGFGGADKKGAYILAWNQVYQTYFGLAQSAFDNANYIYDIAAYEVEPKGQQPYSISGTITPDQNGEVIGGVYMMKSAGDQEAEGALCLKSIDSNSGFTITGSSFAIAETSLNKVVSSLEDETDHKTYTLYFLVKYPRNTLTGYEDIKDWENKVIDKKVRLNATLNLTHTGIYSGEGEGTPIGGETSFCCYDGASQVSARIYWASYYNTAVNSSAGLTMLEKGNTATVEYSADFFCLNEARTDFDSSSTRTMVAIIDLSYVTNNGKQQLGAGDYRFSGFNLSLIDAPGSWSQNASNTPNVGWTPDKYTTPTSGLGNIRVYGSNELTGNNWTEVNTVPAASVWALNQDRAFTGSFTQITTGDYVRLKVEYDSHYTTALRVGYQMELQPGIVSKYSLGNAETLNLTNWVNYGAYKSSTINAENADRDYFKFQRYPTDDSTPVWENYDGTVNEVREYDNASGPSSGLPGYNCDIGTWAETYSLRVFTKTTLRKSDDVAGMLVTQALYDSDGKLVGDPTSIDPNTKDSYSLKTEVANVSEIVYTISGAVTNGSTNLDDLKQRRAAAGANSPYKSLTMRYYVLLPPGLKLNTDPDKGEKTDDGAPKYHFWTAGTTEYLSANSAFYNGNSSKVVQSGQTDVPVTDSNIPGWKRLSANNNLSEMYWVAGGSVTHDTEKSSEQLVVFERTLGDWVDYDRFNMWGASETYVWGRGLSFSVVPEKGTGSLPAGTYTPQFWCQFLDGAGNPISLEGIARKEVEDNPLGQENNTLLYIPSTFVNKHHVGSSDGKIAVSIDENSTVILEDGKAAVKPEGSYSYQLNYEAKTGECTNVVLWCNVEDVQCFVNDNKSSEWRGAVTGVDLKNTGAKVYIRTSTFDANTYKDEANPADKNWLTDPDEGWTEVADPDNYEHWSGVKAIAFYFEGKTFSAANTTDEPSTASVSILMKAPKDDTLTIDGTDKEVGKTVYTAYNELLISDHHGTTEGNKSSCYPTNLVEVPMKVNPVTYELPSTGGGGTVSLYAAGLALSAAAWALYRGLRRGRKAGEGGSA